MQLKKRLDESYIIYIKALEHYSINKYFSNPNTLTEKEYLANNPFFSFVKVSMFKLGVLEINKLLSNSPNDHFGILKTSELLQNSNLPKYHSDQNLKGKLEELNTNNIIIKKLSNLRSKYYAHTDKKRVDPNLLYAEMDIIFDLVYSILNEMFLIYLNVTIANKTVDFDSSKFKLIEFLAEDKKKASNGTI